MCTEFLLPVAAGCAVSGRTMDFAQVFAWQLAVIPEGTALQAIPAPGPARALHWQARHALLGIGAAFQFHLFARKLTDALNSQGLSAAALWLPGSVYPRLSEAPEGAGMVSALDLCGWAASQYATVAELRRDLEAIAAGAPLGDGRRVAFWNPLQLPVELGLSEEVVNLAPLHFQFHDRTGASLVLEFRDGALEIRDNSDLGVLTNAPFLDWHRRNLANQLGVTNQQPRSRRILGLEVPASGNGSGTLGLSASPLPAARFVRTALALDFSQRWLIEQRGQRQRLVAHTLNLLGQVSVLHGQCLEHADAATGDFTQWQLVRDHDELVLHYANCDSLGPWRIGFDDFALAPGNPERFLPLTAIAPMPALPR